MFRWFAEFKRRNGPLPDEDRSGRPATATSPDIVAIVEQIQRDDPRCTYAQIQSALNIGLVVVKII